LLALVALAGVRAFGSEYRVRARIEPGGRITDSQTIRLIIEVEGEDFPKVAVPRLPSLRNLKLLSGPSTSQSSVFQFDGTRSRQVMTSQLIYALIAEGPGPAEVPAIEVRIGADVRRTEPLRFEVERGTSGRPTSPGAAPEADIPVFVEAALGADEVWVGEAVDLDVTLFGATRITGLDMVEEPSFANFWVEDGAPDPAAEAFRTSVDGRPFNAYPIVRKVLVPTTPGTFTLTPYGTRIQVSRSSGDLLRDFFSSSRSRTVIRRTEPLRLLVKPLPAAGRPEDFTGAVGSFRMRSEVDRDAARVNDAVALKVTIEGDGFLRSAPAPLLEPSDELKVFEPKVNEWSEVRDGELRSRKSWEWVLVPLTPGELRLPEIRFPYFDPAAGDYAELTSGDHLLRVERGDAPAGETTAHGEVRLERRDITFIKRRGVRLLDRAPRVHQRGWYVLGLVLPVVLAPIAIVIGRKRARYRRDHGLARARRARSRARRRLRSARQHMERADSGAFHEEVARAVVEYLADRFGRSPSGLTYDLAEELLAARGVDAELRRRVRSCLETCDFARYVESSGEADRRDDIHRQASELIDRLEKVLS
jgi:hypothetical protein